jgi:ATP-dependent Zn protease
MLLAFVASALQQASRGRGCIKLERDREADRGMAGLGHELPRHLAERAAVMPPKAAAPSSTFLSTILSWVLPIFFFYLIWTYGFRRMAERQGLGGLMSIGKSRAKIYVETDTKVTFKDVAGVDEAKFELREVVAHGSRANSDRAATFPV